MTPSRLGRYRLLRCIGRGGMGEVHFARYEAMPGVGKLAAVKVMRLDAKQERAKQAFLAEARLTAYVSHPNVVALLDAGVERDVSWLALELVAGPTLRQILVAAGGGAVRLSPWVIARIAADACAGLHAIHEARDERGRPLEIVHRDVSPQNLLVTWDGIVKVADLGVARSAIHVLRTTKGTIKGKLGYMAPEQASCGPVDRRTDVFAMGVVLWEALSGKRLFVGDDEVETLASVLRCAVPPLRRVAPDVPRALARIVDRALDRDPRARFWTALEMKQALESAMADARVQVHAPEVAATLAELLPDRVREHERWPETVRTAATRTRRAPQAPQGGVPLAIGALLTALAVVAIAIPSLLVMWKLRHPPAMQPVAAALPR